MTMDILLFGHFMLTNILMLQTIIFFDKTQLLSKLFIIIDFEFEKSDRLLIFKQ